ncbi:HAD family phosphatase [Sulfitobacter sp. S190]|uniref:HAD family hydrolase n=1 Tax=Sulfitobacter sp. S190 TaxID=2867022 RepID=UPI0021A864DD|nr:HAD-IA family hydrolase [Sulfitobacter sp. S190]UWR22151.1 HAD-IA family hydrolase [Sulfitobacter sp. S190]
MWKPDFVCFDCDGVLVDSEPLTNAVLRDDLADHGLDLPAEDMFRLFVGGTMKGVMEKSRAMGAQLPDTWLDHIYARMFDVLETECQPIAGAHDLLARLDRAGIGYAVCSNGPTAKMDITLRVCELSGALSGRVYSAYDCAAPKPAPDVYLWAAREAAMLPARCAVVEDSPSGARAGLAAGMRVHGLATDETRAALMPVSNDVVETLAELADRWGI